jgi:Double-GTPase 2
VIVLDNDRPKMSIGVCGESGAGKTVFLTCLFHTLPHAVPAEYVVHHDPKNAGNNALYFGAIEQMLRTTGKTDGTPADALHPITILVTPASPHVATHMPPLAVDLMDFAGGAFHGLAALPASLEDTEASDSRRAALQDVSAFVDSADAFVILISAADLNSLTPRQGSFTASVNTVLAHCRLARKPVALVLSQADRVTPALVDEWKKSPRVATFTRDFSDERGASSRLDGRPFGFVDAVSCYEEIAEGLEPRRQSVDNSIWRLEAARVVYRLIEEAVPAVRHRFEALRQAVAAGDDGGRPAGEMPSQLELTRASDITVRKPRKLVVAVCGEQGAGKTVFLTCLFRTFKYLFADDVSASFAKDTSDAPHFREIENELRRNGLTGGTTATDLPRIELTLAPRAQIENGISVQLMDFAGRHFHTYSASTSRVEGEAEPEGKAGEETVRAFLEKADAFVILISALDLDPESGAHRQDPFGPSIELILEHALQKNKPVALLFSQADRVPRVTQAVLRRSPNVRAFERRFTSNQREAAAGAALFGVARPVSCYNNAPGRNRPIHQPATDSIWRLEPAEIITSLICAVVPRLRREDAAEKAAEEKAEAEKAQQEKEQEQARLERERRNRLLNYAAIGAVAVFLVILTILWIGNASRQQQGQDVQLLDQTANAIRTRPIQPANVQAVLRVLQERPVDDRPVVRLAFDSLQQAVLTAGDQLDGSPTIADGYAEDIARWSSAVDLIRGPARQSATDVRHRLELRQAFVKQWVTSAPPANDWVRRWGRLRSEAAKFAQSDRRFSEYLTSVAMSEKQDDVNHWRQAVPGDATVPGEINRVHGLLQHTKVVLDEDYTRLARNAGAASLVRTILSRRDNRALVDRVIRPLVPDLASTPLQQLQFRELAARALNCAGYECRSRLVHMNSAITDAVREADAVGGAMQNVWASLLPPNRSERLALWAAVAEALGTAYHFDTDSAAWPANVAPLSAQVRRVVELAEQASWDPTNELRDRLSRPMYCDEMLYLRRGFAARDPDPPLRLNASMLATLGRCRALAHRR